MNTKIPLRKFAETLAAKCGISVAEAEGFIKLTFSISAEELRTGSAVRIKGLGAFSLSRNEDDPVNFEPDKNFAAAINSPFAIFSPVELADGVTDEMLSEIDSEAEALAEPDEKAEPALSTEPSPAQEEHEIIVTESVAAEEIAPKEAAPVEIVPEVAVAELSAPETVESREPEPAEQPVQEPDEPAESTPEVLEKEVPAVAEVEKTPAVAEVEEAPAANESTPEPAPAAPEWEYEEEEYVQQPKRNENRFGAGFVAGLIVGIAIGALALCAYVMYYVNSAPENQPVDTELLETVPEPIP